MSRCTDQNGMTCCPRCQEPLIAPLEAAGQTARCKRCDHVFRVPAAEVLLEDAVLFILLHDAHDRPRITDDDYVSYEQLMRLEWVGQEEGGQEPRDTPCAPRAA